MPLSIGTKVTEPLPPPRGRTCHYDPQARIWTGLRTPTLFNVNQSLGQLVLSQLERCDPQHVTQISADRNGLAVTCGEMHQRTVRVAQHLARLGYGQGTMAALVSRNGETVAPVMFACFTLGITVNSLDTSFSVADFAHMLGITRPVLLFCESGVLEKTREGCAQVGLDPVIVLFEDRVDGYQHVNDLLEPTGVEHLFVAPTLDDPANSLAAILCSSGTTGLSKGVSYTHAFCIANLPVLWRMTPSESVLAFSSLYWLSGFASLVIGTICQATRIITRDPFTTDRALDILERYRVAIAFFSPFQANLLVNEPRTVRTNLDALRMMLCGGARVSKELYFTLVRVLPARTVVTIGYGMSESCLITLTDGSPYRHDTVGTLQARTEAKIVDETATRPLDLGEAGEVLLRVQYPFGGYYGDVDATAATVGPDGWIRTGDIGHFDADGYLYIVDRKKDILKCAGYQVSPTELEAIVKQMSGVVECCVVGLPDIGNDLPAAIILRTPDTTVTEQEVVQYVQGRVADYKRLRGGVYFASELPLTPSGKVVRRKCLEMIKSMRRAGDGDDTAP